MAVTCPAPSPPLLPPIYVVQYKTLYKVEPTEISGGIPATISATHLLTNCINVPAAPIPRSSITWGYIKTRETFRLAGHYGYFFPILLDSISPCALY